MGPQTWEPDQVWANLGQLLGGSDISDETSGIGRGLADKRGAGLVSRQREGLYQVKPSEGEFVGGFAGP